MTNTLDLSEAYVAYAAQLRMYILKRVGDQETADELLSQVFECACRDAHHYQDRGFPVSSWLYRIAHSRISDYYRAERRRAHFVTIEDCDLADDGGIADAESRLASGPLMSAIEQLRPSQRAVVLLRFVLDREIAFVADALAISENAVKALQHRALANLRTALNPLPPPIWARCAVCGERAEARGLCGRHYRQQLWHRKKGHRPRWERDTRILARDAFSE